MTINTFTFDAPACWASYYINGDASGLEPEEKALADDFLVFEDIPAPVSCAEESHIGTFHFTGLQTELLEYTSLIEVKG
jgi:hypothetical protein